MKIKLYEFPHSHFCEVARWALDFKGLDYQSVPLLPGWHAIKMKKLGLQTSLPVLEIDESVVQGSSAILDFLDEKFPEKSLAPDLPITEIHALETNIAQTIGVPLRRLCYYALLPHPELVRFCFMHRSGILEQCIFRATYGVLQRRLIGAYDITQSGAESAERELEDAIAAHERLLDGRQYLVGDTFSRVDLSFAALFAFMVMPPRYPVPWPDKFNSLAIKDWFDSKQETRSYQHVERMYQRHR